MRPRCDVRAVAGMYLRGLIGLSRDVPQSVPGLVRYRLTNGVHKYVRAAKKDGEFFIVQRRVKCR